MSDDVKPPEKPTQPLPKEEIQAGLLNKLVGAVNDIKDGVNSLRADVGMISNDLGIVKDRVSLVERRATDLEEARRLNSLRARSQSEVDQEHDAQLVQERAARESLAKKVDEIERKTDAQTAILERLDRVASNPTVKALAHIIATGIAAYLATKGIHP